jgi:hypothetical protein
VAVSKERKDEIKPMKKHLMENLHIHLANANAELARVHRLRNTLPTPEEYAKVNGDHLVKKQFVLQLLFGALITYMVTLFQSEVQTSTRILDHHQHRAEETHRSCQQPSTIDSRYPRNY